MRLAMANSFTTIVAAELIAANEGLGKMLWDGRMFMLADEIFVSLVSLGLLGVAVDRMVRWRLYTVAGQQSPATWPIARGGARVMLRRAQTCRRRLPSR